MEGTLVGNIAKRALQINHIGLYGLDMEIRLDKGEYNVTTYRIVSDDRGIRKVKSLFIAGSRLCFATNQEEVVEYDFKSKQIEADLLKEVDEQRQNWLDYKAGKISRPCF